MLSNFNSWLTSTLLPWTCFQRFMYSDMPHAPYRIPAEWTPHRRTLMAWPERISVDRDDQLHRAQTEVADIAEIIGRYEPVWLYSAPGSEAIATPWVSSVNVTVKVDDLELPWIRDSGPLLTESANGRLVGVDLKYNYLGSRTSFSKQHDAKLAARILKDQHIHRTKSGIVLQGGGAFEVDGAGTLLAAEGAILDTNRTLYASKDAVEHRFSNLFGIEKTIWLPQAASQETTDSRVGHLARFAPNDIVLLSRPNVGVLSSDPAWHIYKESKEILHSSTNAAGRRFHVVEIEQALTVPYARIADPGHRLATSYLSYYLPNGAVVVPQFGDDRANDEAMRVMREVWPGREVVGVKIDMLAWMGGAVHSATMQWPFVGSEGQGDEVEWVACGREDEL